MAFFRNRTVNLLNLHYAIHSVALTGGAAFFCVYLLKAGLTMPQVLVAIAAILIGRLIIRPLVVPLAVRFGMRALVIAGTIMSAMQYPLLATVHGVGPPLYLLCAVSSVGDTVYWSTYHAYYAALGEHENRGAHVGAREAISAVVGIVSPVVTGFVLLRFGAAVAFTGTALVLLLAALPLLFTPEVRIARVAPGAIRAAWSGVKLFMSDGWTGAGAYFVWQMALFASLGQEFLAFGGALAIAALSGAVAGLFLGRHIDAGHGTRAVLVAIGGFALVIVLRAASLGHPALAVAANALASVGSCLYIPTLLTAVYNQAKQSPCTLRFHVAAEGGWDIGGAAGCLVAALLLSLGVRMSIVLLLPLAGFAWAFVQLWRYYARNSQVSSVAV